jgi:hypothetical protein
MAARLVWQRPAGTWCANARRRWKAATATGSPRSCARCNRVMPRSCRHLSTCPLATCTRPTTAVRPAPQRRGKVSPQRRRAVLSGGWVGRGHGAALRDDLTERTRDAPHPFTRGGRPLARQRRGLHRSARGPGRPRTHPPPRVWRFLRSDCASILSEEVACFKCTAGECAHSLGVAGQVEKQEACAALLEHISSALAAARVSPHDHAGRRALPAPPTPLRTPARAQRPQPLPSANVNPFFSCDRTSCGRGACCASAA